jgi:putative membrane protein
MLIIGWFLLGIQAAIVIASLLGYGIFTARPDLLVQVDPQAKFFVWAFQGFAVGNMFFGGLAVLANALRTDRSKALWAFMTVYLVSLLSELMGTTYGVPFGAYSYTALLGTKWFDRVPLLIPLSWFTMSWACWVIARQRSRGVRAVLLAAALLVAWDLLLDPAMSKVTSYWLWAEPGAYYDMPLLNLVGWGVTGLALFIILNKIVPNPHGKPSFALSVYLVNFSLPLGFCILNGYWLAAFAAPAAIAVVWMLATRLLNAAAVAQQTRDSLTAAQSALSQRN